MAVTINNLVDIKGIVFDDLNNNGVRDSGEAGIEGVTVELRKADDSLIATRITDAGGALQLRRCESATRHLQAGRDPAG